MAIRAYGCTTIVNAVCLQFELAGHGLYTDIRCSRGGMWLCEAALKRPEHSTFRQRWMDQAPKELS